MLLNKGLLIVAVVAHVATLGCCQQMGPRVGTPSGSCTLDTEAALISCQGAVTPTLKSSPQAAGGGGAEGTHHAAWPWPGAVQALWGKPVVHVVMEGVDFNEHGWMEQLVKAVVGLGEPNRHINITLKGCSLVLKRSRLDVGYYAIPESMKITLTLQDCTVTLNRIKLRGKLTSQGPFALDFVVRGGSLSHNRLLVEKGSWVGPFPDVHPSVRLLEAYVADDLVVVGWERKTPKVGAAIPIAMLLFLILLIGCLALPGLHRCGSRPHAPRPPTRTISLPPIKISHASSWHRWPAAPGPSGADSPVAHGVIDAESYA